MKSLLRPLLLLPLLLAACTGTDETPPSLRLVLLTDGGATLRAVTPNPDDASGQPPTAPVTANQTVTVVGGLALTTPPTARRIVLTRRAGVDSRNADLGDIQAFAALPESFTPVCLTTSATNAARDRVLVLGECEGGPQRLALYRENGTLVWTALLPTFAQPIPSPDNPPIRLAVLGEVGLVTRPRSTTTSEVIRVAQTSTGATTAEPSTPVTVPAVRDLAPYGPDIVAATDSGLQRLKLTGEPDPTLGLSAFGSARYDRVWSGLTGSRTLLAAWSKTNATLSVWDGGKTNADTLSGLNDLRDVSLALDGYMYVLTPSTLLRYDTVFGLQNGSWDARTLLSSLNNARAVTWVLPPTAR